MSWLFISGGQSFGVSASVLPVSIQDWSPLGLTLGSTWSPRDSQESSPTPQFRSINSSVLGFLYGPTLTSVHGYWKKHSFDYMDFVSKTMSLLFNMLSRFVITFLPWNKHLLISRLQSPSVVILESKKIVCHCFHCFSIYLLWSNRPRCHDLSFLNIEFCQPF